MNHTEDEISKSLSERQNHDREFTKNTTSWFSHDFDGDMVTESNNKTSLFSEKRGLIRNKPRWMNLDFDGDMVTEPTAFESNITTEYQQKTDQPWNLPAQYMMSIPGGNFEGYMYSVSIQIARYIDVERLILAHNPDTIPTLRKLIAEGFDVNLTCVHLGIVGKPKPKPYLLEYACDLYHDEVNYELVKMLLENGANPNLYTYQPLLVNALHYTGTHQADVISLLLQYNVNMDIIKDKIFCQINRMSLRTLKVLLDERFDPNVKDQHGETALTRIREVDENFMKKVKMLIDYGADINVRNSKNESILDYYPTHKEEILSYYGKEDLVKKRQRDDELNSSNKRSKLD